MMSYYEAEAAEAAATAYSNALKLSDVAYHVMQEMAEEDSRFVLGKFMQDEILFTEWDRQKHLTYSGKAFISGEIDAFSFRVQVETNDQEGHSDEISQLALDIMRQYHASLMRSHADSSRRNLGEDFECDSLAFTRRFL